MTVGDNTYATQNEVILDNIEVVRSIGFGAASRVLEVIDHNQGGKRCAAKVVGSEAGGRIAWEWEVLSSLRHPNLVRVGELLYADKRVFGRFGLKRGDWILLQELVEGATAAEASATTGAVGSRERLAFVLQVGYALCRGLGALHARGLGHGDIKPANVIVGDEPTAAVLLDLDLCRPFCVSGSVSGTPAYMAPEGWTGVLSEATDVYSLGMSLHTMLGGDMEAGPLSALSIPDMERDARRLVTRGPLEVYGAELDGLLEDLCSLRPEQRISSAAEAARRIRHTLHAISPESTLPGDAWDAPSATILASRAAFAPLTGRQKALKALREALRSDDCVAVVGPKGAGRTRLVREAVRMIQVEALSANEVPGTYCRWDKERQPDPRGELPIVHILDGHLWSDDELAAAIREGLIAGRNITWVVECIEFKGAASRIECGPVSRATLGALLLAVTGEEPSEHLLRVVSAETGGLMGRCCRDLIELYQGGVTTVSAGAYLKAVGGQERTDGVSFEGMSRDARSLLALMVALGGCVRPEQYGPAAVRGSAMEVLRRKGAAYFDALGVARLRRTWWDAAWVAMPNQVVKEWAQQASSLGLDPLQSEFVDCFQGETTDYLMRWRSRVEAEHALGDASGRITGGLRLFRVTLARGLDAKAMAWMLAELMRAQGEYSSGIGVLADAGLKEESPLWFELRRLSSSESNPTTGTSQPRTGALNCAAGWGLYDRGSYAEAVAVGGEIFASNEPDRERCRAVELVISASVRLGDLTHARRVALAGLREFEGTREEARLQLSIGNLEHADSQFSAAAEHYEVALRLSLRYGEEHLEASASMNLGLLRVERGDLGGALTALRRSGGRLARWGRERDLARVFFNIALTASLAGDNETVAVMGQEARRAATRIGDRGTLAYLATVEADLLLGRGSPEAALRVLRLAIAPAEQVSSSIGALLRCRLALLEGARGQVEDAYAAWRAMEPLIVELNAHAITAEWCVLGARLQQWRGDMPAALQWVDRSVASADLAASFECRLTVLLAAADVAQVGSQDAKASRYRARARGLLEEAATSLSPAGRALMRKVPRYAIAWASATGAATVGSGSDVWRKLADYCSRFREDMKVTDLYDRLVEVAMRLVPAERAVLLREVGEKEIEVVLAINASGDKLPTDSLSVSQSIQREALSQDTAIASVDAGDATETMWSESVVTLQLRSVACVPFAGDEGQRMLLYLDDRLRPGAFEEEQLHLMQQLTLAVSRVLRAAVSLREVRFLHRREQSRRLRAEAAVIEQAGELHHLRERSHAGGLVAGAASMQSVLTVIERAACTDTPLLLEGESGTGKELLARQLHSQSARAAGPFVVVSCGSLSVELAESTLFGHERGAFTGAVRTQRGLFERAHGGTLYFAGLEDLLPGVQAKLLRVLQEREVRRVGGTKSRSLDIRLVASTASDLSDSLHEATFRRDLFYRFAVLRLQVPPLRSRLEDLPELTRLLLRRHSPNREVSVSPEALSVLMEQSWPGNIRELENALRAALVLADDRIEPSSLPFVVPGAPLVSARRGNLKDQVAALEKRLIEDALREAKGNQTKAAEALGVSRYGLQKMVKRLGINVGRYQAPSR